MDRREFLAATAASAAAAALSRPSPAKDPSAMLPVIDTHQHLWDLGEFRPPWLKDGEPLAFVATPKEYADAVAGLNVVKSVYMEVDMAPGKQIQAEADYVAALCESGKTTMRAAVVGGRPDDEGFAKYAGQFKGSKYVKGVRRVLHGDIPAGLCLKPEFVKGVRLLGDLGLSFDLCVRWAELPDMAKLVDECPGTRFILDHCGNPKFDFTKADWDRWRSLMGDMAKRPNVVCKVSGFLANGWPKGKWTAEQIAPAVNGTIAAFGWDRVMFGGDWPVVTLAASYKEWLTGLRQVIADRPAADQRKLLHDNAERFYGI